MCLSMPHPLHFGRISSTTTFHIFPRVASLVYSSVFNMYSSKPNPQEFNSWFFDDRTISTFLFISVNSAAASYFTFISNGTRPIFTLLTLLPRLIKTCTLMFVFRFSVACVPPCHPFRNFTYIVSNVGPILENIVPCISFNAISAWARIIFHLLYHPCIFLTLLYSFQFLLSQASAILV